MVAGKSRNHNTPALSPRGLRSLRMKQLQRNIYNTNSIHNSAEHLLYLLDKVSRRYNGIADGYDTMKLGFAAQQAELAVEKLEQAIKDFDEEQHKRTHPPASVG